MKRIATAWAIVLLLAATSSVALQKNEASQAPTAAESKAAPADAPRAGARAGATWPSEAEIREILRGRIDVAKKGVGIVVGLIDDKGTRIISYGKVRHNGDALVDGDSVFEIGSITKTFTGLLLSDMVEKGEVKLDDPISKYLPKTVKAHKVKGKEITLLNLTRHTSGLPRLPDNFAPKDPANPYVDYTAKDLYAFLNKYKSTREIGANYEYSNLGVGLLGHALERRAGKDYESVLRARVLQPLEMSNTAITLTPFMKSHLAVGHWDRVPVANWDFATLAGAGALRSTARDMLKYLAANLGLNKTALLPAMERTHEAVEVSRYGGVEIGLGWGAKKYAGTEVVMHGGRTAGYRTYVGMDKKNRRGVVVLANSDATDVETIGGHLLNNGYVLAKLSPPPPLKAMKLDTKLLDAYVGSYKLTPESSVEFTRDGERFFAKVPTAPKFEVFAESEAQFFAEDIDAAATLRKGDQGAVYLTLRLGDRFRQGKKDK